MKRLIIAAAVLVAAPAAAIFIRAGEPVPLERLFRNVSDHVRRTPKDPQAHYTLGRLHSLAFVKSATTVHVISAPGKLPAFPPYESVKVQPDQSKPTGGALKHLAASIRSYATATRLDPKSSLYRMGLGWMLEQGAPYAGRVGAPWTTGGAKRPASEWLNRSLGAYRQAYALDYRKDLQAGHIGPGADTAISLEAGEGILRILGNRELDAAGRSEQARVKKTVGQLAALPRAVTPIIFPLDAPAPLAGLLSPGSARFDLAGDGRGERWPWVNASTGILVWDPERTGRIASGTQLFGTATWSMYWRDGYEALAALDDNRDQRLAGRELNGWRSGGIATETLSQILARSSHCRPMALPALPPRLKVAAKTDRSTAPVSSSVTAAASPRTTGRPFHCQPWGANPQASARLPAPPAAPAAHRG